LGVRASAERGVAGSATASLERPDVLRAAEQLRTWQAEGAQIAASCVGTFLAAESGLLDQREATTTWCFRRCSGSAIRGCGSTSLACLCRRTSGDGRRGDGAPRLGPLADRKASPELASLVSRYLLADIRSSQAPYIIPTIWPRRILSSCGSSGGAGASASGVLVDECGGGVADLAGWSRDQGRSLDRTCPLDAQILEVGSGDSQEPLGNGAARSAGLR